MFSNADSKVIMAVKEWFRKYQPLQLHIVLIMTILFLLVELAVSHITHALTLLMNSYQMLCNILALMGYIATVKFQSRDLQNCPTAKPLQSAANHQTINDNSCTKSVLQVTEHKLKNTFGWARIDVVSMLICCVFCASLCFSVLVEALQTLIHIGHLHEMHHPISVFCMGVAGILVNIGCYVLIGGYTFHQGCFLYVTNEGEVVLNKVAPTQVVRQGERRLSRTKTTSSELVDKRQNLREMCRDTLGCILVIICSIWVYFADEHSVKYIDPGIAVFHALSLMVLSFPYMKESCFILLQTMPGSIDIDSLRVDLVKKFPEIVNVHDFHVWQLTADKVISTVHIIFQRPEVYTRIKQKIKNHFAENGITQVTIQPEFFTQSNNGISPVGIIKCLMACQSSCGACLCCPEIEEDKDVLLEIKHSSQESLPANSNATSSSTAPVNQEPCSKIEEASSILEQGVEEKNLLKPDEKLRINAQEILEDIKEETNAHL